MKGKITIGNKNVELVANAATPVFFKQIFHEDFFILAENFAVSPTNGESVDIYSRIAFVASQQAKKADMESLTFSDYVKWLEQFEAYDMAQAVDSIAEIYAHQAEPTAKPKK